LRTQTRMFRLPGARTLRAALAAVLACAVLAGASQSGTHASGGNCPMPCCARKSARRGGPSCSGGSCHARLGKRAAPRDPVCGVPLSSTRRGAATRRPSDALATLTRSSAHTKGPAARTGDARGDRPEGVQASVLTRPCAPDCGACAGSSAQLRRTRDAVALSHAERPRPPNPARRYSSPASLAFNAVLLEGACSPRAPPSADSRTFTSTKQS
jgi:hypothetical protein